MALNAFLKAVSPTRGWIKGSVTQKGRENLIKVVRADHLEERPLDPASFTAAATIQHRPFTIAKEVDAASVGLRTSFVSGEKFSEWKLMLWRAQMQGAAGIGGVERQHFTVELTGARIQSIRLVLPDTRDPAFNAWLDYEEVAFVYDKIRWTWTDGQQTLEEAVQRPPGAKPRIVQPKRRR